MEAPGPAEGDDDSGEKSDDLRFKHFTVLSIAQVIAWTEACLFPAPLSQVQLCQVPPSAGPAQPQDLQGVKEGMKGRAPKGRSFEVMRVSPL